MKIVGWLLLLAFSNSACAVTGLPGQITFQVIEEGGRPIEGAHVMMRFIVLPDSEVSRGETDSNGLYTATGRSSDSSIFGVTKEGYYETEGNYRFSIRGPSDESRKQGRWLPWNPTYKVVLRKKINPVGMYWKKVEGQHGIIPTGQPVGYDLVIGDWVSPHGSGKTSDVIFNSQGEFIDFNNQKSSVTITFSNQEDGIQILNRPKPSKEYLGKSQFALPYTSPENAYQHSWRYEHAVYPTGQRVESEQAKDQILFFRVRTKMDQSGSIISALYGRLEGEFIGRWRGEKAVLSFTYYLNPDGTRNMEHDPGKLIDLKGGR